MLWNYIELEVFVSIGLWLSLVGFYYEFVNFELFIF